ncbi:MAG: molecular chaperone HtpG [Spirochaetaceae bacterium]|nr:molecular chaperone HtpG [Spirochaetaceae bacterium]
MAKKQFKAEVDRLLKLIIHSLYSNNEIFLRELISNASDAIDKMKFLTLTNEQFKTDSFAGQIDISLDTDAATITITDNGIGMNSDDLEENLGKIAHSGSSEFLAALEAGAKKDSNIIGQFGVGFYSVFMVSNNVTVISRKAGELEAHSWQSDGESGYTLSKAERDNHGTTIIIKLNDENKEFAHNYKIEELIERYSNHIAFPIFLHYTEKPFAKEGEEPKEEAVDKQINSAKALWQLSKSQLKAEDYNEFYHTICHDSENPLFYSHTRAEGNLDYTTLFYIPAKAPFDLFQANYKAGVKLYVKRVFITDDEKELLPVWLRFVRGIIDSEDLPLNVSREILQKNKILESIRTASVKKLLSEFKKLSESEPEKFKTFIENYNKVLKEGLYIDFAYRPEILEVVRFKSTADTSEWTSLAAYKERMPQEQKNIYYITGEKENVVRANPLLAAYKEKGIEVLLLSDQVDEFVMPMLGQYEGLNFKAINSGEEDELFKDNKIEETAENKELADKLKEALGDKVEAVKLSSRLSDLPAVIVSGSNGVNLQMAQMFKMMGQEAPEGKPILEVNPNHALIKSLMSLSGDEVKDYANILLDSAYLAEGVLPKEPANFAATIFKLLKQPS